MCGFVGVCGGPPPEGPVEQILQSRGPHGRGVYEGQEAWLLHRRLAIIDPIARSNQPFALSDGGSWSVYNGELYNYQRLSTLLESVRTAGDTEVFSELLNRNPGVCSQFRGMYAAAITSGSRTRLARDRFGIKPLYWAVDDNAGLMFASQLRCFRKAPRPARIAQEAIASVLTYGLVAGRTTMYKGVAEQAPGTVSDWEDGRLVEEWRPELTADLPLGDALRATVDRHLVADVPVCTLLSGGLDSAVVAALAATGGREQPLAVTLSVGGEIDESVRARRTAQHYGLDQEIIEIGLDEAAGALDDFFDAMDQPTIDGLNMFLISRAVHDLGYTVALSGLGADELFGGYSTYRLVAAARGLRFLPEPAFRAAIVRLMPLANRHKIDRILSARHSTSALQQITREVFSTSEVRQLCGGDAPSPPVPDGARLLAETGDPVFAGELGLYMRQAPLRSADTYGMAASVEIRVPFLDDDVYAASLKRAPYQRAMGGKRILATSLDDRYLIQLAKERKTGFRLPMAKWLDGMLAERVDAALTSGSPLSRHVDVIRARELVGSDYPWSRQWTLLILNEWLARNEP